jgi:hypothetical protein
MGTSGLLRGDPMTDIAKAATPVGGVEDVEQISTTPDGAAGEEVAMPDPARASGSYAPEPHAPPPPEEPPVAPAAVVIPPPPPPKAEGRPSQPQIVREAASSVFAPAVARSKGILDVLAELERDPRAPGVGDTLAVLARQVEGAAKAQKIEEALQIITGLIRIEQTVPEGSARRNYGIALKRMFTKSTLETLAQMATVPAYQADATSALRRAGADGVEVLLDLLVAAPTVNERRHVFNALTQIKQGADQLVNMLGHHQWFVVRNIAELVGELSLEDAVPALAKQLEHEDERVRKAVALALAKIGSRAAAEPLRRAFRDPSAGVRLHAALGVGGRKAAALAMPLVVALEDEKDAEVQRELVLALGRIGSPDAVQALIKFAQPAGKLFRRKPTGLRVAAVEALRLAGTPAAVGTLQGLVGDSDRQVNAAAQGALAELRKRPAPSTG